MRSPREAIREDISILVHLQESGADARVVHASCLKLVDRAASWAADVHGNVPAAVLSHLSVAMRAAACGDVVGVIIAVEKAIGLIGQRS